MEKMLHGGGDDSSSTVSDESSTFSPTNLGKQINRLQVYLGPMLCSRWSVCTFRGWMTVAYLYIYLRVQPFPETACRCAVELYRSPVSTV